MTATVLHHEESGRRDGAVLVFLHGFMENCRSLQTIMNAFTENHRCIAFDLPGHGYSLFCRTNSLNNLKTFEDAANLVLQDLDAMGVGRFSLYGYSMGGRIGQNMALLVPERIDRLVLESASFGIADPEERQQRYLRDSALLTNVRTEKDLAAFLEGWYRLPLFSTLANTPQLQQILQEKRKNNIEELRRSLKILSVGNHPFFAERIAGLNIPLFYFCGERDEAYTGTAQMIKRKIPSMNVAIFPNASHDIHSQHPEKIIGALKRALSGSAATPLSTVKEGTDA